MYCMSFVQQHCQLQLAHPPWTSAVVRSALHCCDSPPLCFVLLRAGEVCCFPLAAAEPMHVTPICSGSRELWFSWAPAIKTPAGADSSPHSLDTNWSSHIIAQSQELAVKPMREARQDCCLFTLFSAKALSPWRQRQKPYGGHSFNPSGFVGASRD
jgi:hypothetical protein